MDVLWRNNVLQGLYTVFFKLADYKKKIEISEIKNTEHYLSFISVTN